MFDPIKQLCAQLKFEIEKLENFLQHFEKLRVMFVLNSPQIS